ncbi:MAG: hypothetical protein ABIG89_03585 [Candidatus Woesearchaeota archaeon]
MGEDEQDSLDGIVASGIQHDIEDALQAHLNLSIIAGSLIDRKKIKIKPKERDKVAFHLALIGLMYMKRYSKYLFENKRDESGKIHLDVSDLEERLLRPIVSLYQQFIDRNRRFEIAYKFETGRTTNVYKRFDGDALGFIEKMANLPCVIEKYNPVTKEIEPDFVNVFELAEYLDSWHRGIMYTFLDGFRTKSISELARARLFLQPGINGVEYRPTKKIFDEGDLLELVGSAMGHNEEPQNPIEKVYLSLRFNTDWTDNIFHDVDTCRFNFEDSTLGSLLDTADARIHYLVLNASNRKRNDTLGIAILHEVEADLKAGVGKKAKRHAGTNKVLGTGNDKEQKPKQYILVEGFYGLEALNLNFRDQDGTSLGYELVFEYIYDSLVKLADRKGVELIFNVSFNTAHHSQGNLEWANFIVKKLHLDNKEPLYVYEKVKSGSRVYKENKKHKKLDNEWPTIAVKRLDDELMAKVLGDRITRLRYCNSFFKGNEKVLLSKAVPKDYGFFQWCPERGQVRYLKADKQTIDETVITLEGKQYHYRKKSRFFFPLLFAATSAALFPFLIDNGQDLYLPQILVQERDKIVMCTDAEVRNHVRLVCDVDGFSKEIYVHELEDVVIDSDKDSGLNGGKGNGKAMQDEDGVKDNESSEEIKDPEIMGNASAKINNVSYIFRFKDAQEIEEFGRALKLRELFEEILKTVTDPKVITEKGHYCQTKRSEFESQVDVTSYMGACTSDLGVIVRLIDLMSRYSEEDLLIANHKIVGKATDAAYMTRNAYDVIKLINFFAQPDVFNMLRISERTKQSTDMMVDFLYGLFKRNSPELLDEAVALAETYVSEGDFHGYSYALYGNNIPFESGGQGYEIFWEINNSLGALENEGLTKFMQLASDMHWYPYKDVVLVRLASLLGSSLSAGAGMRTRSVNDSTISILDTFRLYADCAGIGKILNVAHEIGKQGFNPGNMWFEVYFYSRLLENDCIDTILKQTDGTPQFDHMLLRMFDIAKPPSEYIIDEEMDFIYTTGLCSYLD